MTNGVYRIKVKELLDESRAGWFEGWDITREQDGTTTLTSQVADQSSLHGALVKIRNLNLTIISVNCIKSDNQ